MYDDFINRFKGVEFPTLGSIYYTNLAAVRVTTEVFCDFYIPVIFQSVSRYSYTSSRLRSLTRSQCFLVGKASEYGKHSYLNIQISLAGQYMKKYLAYVWKSNYFTAIEFKVNYGLFGVRQSNFNFETRLSSIMQITKFSIFPKLVFKMINVRGPRANTNPRGFHWPFLNIAAKVLNRFKYTSKTKRIGGTYFTGWYAGYPIFRVLRAPEEQFNFGLTIGDNINNLRNSFRNIIIRRRMLRKSRKLASGNRSTLRRLNIVCVKGKLPFTISKRGASRRRWRPWSYFRKYRIRKNMAKRRRKGVFRSNKASFRGRGKR